MGTTATLALAALLLQPLPHDASMQLAFVPRSSGWASPLSAPFARGGYAGCARAAPRAAAWVAVAADGRGDIDASGISGPSAEPPACAEGRRLRVERRQHTSSASAKGRPRRGPSMAQVKLNKRLTRCDEPYAVIVELTAAEESGLALSGSYSCAPWCVRVHACTPVTCSGTMYSRRRQRRDGSPPRGKDCGARGRAAARGDDATAAARRPGTSARLWAAQRPRVDDTCLEPRPHLRRHLRDTDTFGRSQQTAGRSG